MANGTITIDTDEFISRLTRAKVSRPQAEAIVKGIEMTQQKQTMGEILLEIGKGLLIVGILDAMLIGAFWLGGYTAGLN